MIYNNQCNYEVILIEIVIINGLLTSMVVMTTA